MQKYPDETGRGSNSEGWSIEIGERAEEVAEILGEEYDLKLVHNSERSRVYQRSRRNRHGFITQNEENIYIDNSYDREEIAEVLKDEAIQLSEKSEDLEEVASELEPER